MPVVHGRLTCCVCGADLGDASDPYRDPSCGECLQREAEQDWEADQAEDIDDGGREALKDSR
jgi:hypothetical protein